MYPNCNTRARKEEEMKRANGTGSVYKLTGKRRKPWVVMVTTGHEYTTKGKVPKRKPLGYYKTRLEAEGVLLDYNKGLIDVDTFGATFAEVKELWAREKYKNASESAFRIYEAAFKRFFEIHDEQFLKIRPHMLQEQIDEYGKSYSSRSHMKTLINQMYEFAIANDIAFKNYSGTLEVGTKTKSDLHKPFTEKEIKKLFENVHVDFVDMILIMIHTGMRIKDLVNPIKYKLDQEYIRVSSKTAAGRDRIVPLHKNVLSFAEQRYEKYKGFFEGVMRYDIYSDRFSEVMEILRMDHLPYDTRHTFVTEMDRTPANKTAVKRIVGHSSQGITEGVYTHKNLQDLKEAISFFPDYSMSETARVNSGYKRVANKEIGKSLNSTHL